MMMVVVQTPDGPEEVGLRADEFITVGEAAKMVKLGTSTLHRHLATGTVPGRVVFGRAVRVHTPTFLAWARRQAAESVLRGEES